MQILTENDNNCLLLQGNGNVITQVFLRQPDDQTAIQVNMLLSAKISDKTSSNTRCTFLSIVYHPESGQALSALIWQFQLKFSPAPIASCCLASFRGPKTFNWTSVASYYNNYIRIYCLLPFGPYFLGIWYNLALNFSVNFDIGPYRPALIEQKTCILSLFLNWVSTLCNK